MVLMVWEVNLYKHHTNRCVYTYIYMSMCVRARHIHICTCIYEYVYTRICMYIHMCLDVYKRGGFSGLNDFDIFNPYHNT